MKRIIHGIKGLYYPFAVALIMVVLVVTRFWRVATIPTGMHIDEIGMAYDAWSLAQYGVDRKLLSWPVYLNNFGGGQSSLYCFMCAGLFKLFGYHILWVRVPGIIGSFLGVIFSMLLARKMFTERKELSLLTGLMMTVCPYFIMASRFGLDCNLMMGFSVLFLYTLVTAIEKKSYVWYACAGVAGGILLYTYVISHIVLPIFLLLILMYMICTKRFSWRHFLVMGASMGCLAFPLILFHIVNTFDLPNIHLGVFTVAKLDIDRATEMYIPTWGSFTYVFKKVFRGDVLDYNSVPEYPNLFRITVPFFALGLAYSIATLVRSIKHRVSDAKAYILLWFVAMVLIGSMMNANSNRINGVFGTVILLAVVGVYVLCSVLKKYATVLVMAVCAIYCGLFLDFGSFYYSGQYTQEYYPLSYFEIPVTEAVDYLEEHPEHQNKGTFMAQTGICYALSSFESPYNLDKIENVGVYNEYYHTGPLLEIEEDYNYIVTDIYVDYAQELRELGYIEIKYPRYSLFIWEEK